MLHAPRIVLFGVAAIALSGAGLWAAMAIWFRLIPSAPLAMVVAGAMLPLTLAAVIGLCRRRWTVVMVYGACLMVVVLWYATLTPSNDRAWAPDVARAVHGSIEGDRLVLHDLRNFVWRGETDFDERWETRGYDLNRITGVDLFMSYWAGETIAHTILSFGFANGDQLAFSIEIRKERTEAYSALAGFFRSYELSMIAADERDVVGVRTNIRGEDVRLFRLRIAPEKARALLVEYVARANALHRTPRFYNSLTTNCTTVIFQMVRSLQPGFPLDYRILLSGLLPDYIYEIGGLDTRLPLRTLRDRSHIEGRARSDDPAFSRKIREGVPNPLAGP